MRRSVKNTVSTMLLFGLMILGAQATALAKVGWENVGWSGANFLSKACNSKTTVFDEPKYSYMSATAKIGSKQTKKHAYSPSPYTSVHAVAFSGYNETCYTWGNAY
ncbi:hypothetical protein PT181_03395 [Erysipelothrix rhusiopathiae]|uniref:hypothetical protein n=1 Tax=Erysipelothrix TaxID=1647 RepID=UPI001F1E9734|nr:MULTISPECIES: hypothetical protein [Erysipelothrix]MDE8071678.1 hypothetical protein [Erysipelothrix rhusiopathiae]MDE8081856.1 hypothetical protein [Erysipelothrix rhusiopathiae]MDE8119510.1 hypothetical protein [Erysipelothrix rhusiopathiae]MDE8132269.1 hypothetical protein [Erysipelothrix rhusiopathiae]MDE8147644.1 hypothetical protein [Erysipelothrix rhusiopathiae]